MKKIVNIEVVSHCSQCSNWGDGYICKLTDYSIGSNIAYNTINENCPLENYNILGLIRIFFNWMGKG